MSYKDLIYDVDEKIATITLNRPERMNALSRSLEGELHRAFDEADADRAVKVIILTGAGRAFCAGRDQGAAPGGGAAQFRPEGQVACRVHRAMAAQRSARKSWNGRICGGWASRSSRPSMAGRMGAGFWYQLAADVTIASDQAVFAQPEVRHISATSFLFTALCGWKAANRWGLTGDHFDAQEALRIRMVDQVVPHDRTDADGARVGEAHGAGTGAGAAPQ